jgi:hypothetical protein
MQQPTAKLIDRFALLGGTLCLVARQYDVPSRTFWVDLLEDRGYLVVVLIAFIGVFGTLTPFEVIAEKKLIERRTATRHQILLHFGRMLEIARRATPPIPLGDLGLHIWRIRRSLRHPLRGQLVRVATYRLGSTPATRSFSPPIGVGVVGLSWKRNEEVSVDVARLATDLPDEATYLAYRDASGADSVMGLSWSEFVRVRHRGAVFASPVRNGSGIFIGCVSMDAGSGYDSLNNDDLWQEVNRLCGLIGERGFQYV